MMKARLHEALLLRSVSPERNPAMSTDTSSVDLDRHGLEVLRSDECWSLLARTPIGRVAFIHAGEPKIIPVAHLVVDHHLAFRSIEGAKLGVAAMKRPVGFEVDRWDPETSEGWSVLVEGFAEIVYDKDEEADLESRGLSTWTPDGVATLWVRIIPTDISGRRLRSQGSVQLSDD
jgi:nitroimidazol reductase NimA-like FMN-containing flavoprotein (pyridoxamine 5'-phosphate oxidase superfamily)